MIKIRGLSCLNTHKSVLSKPEALPIDIRSSIKFPFADHPIDAIHISWIGPPHRIENKNVSPNLP